MQDGAVHADIAKLANLGTSGVHSGHMARDLQGCLPTSPLDEALVKVPLRVLVNSQFVEAIHRIILPHRLFASMWLQGGEEFQRYWFDGNVKNLEKFWAMMPDRKKPAAEHIKVTIPVKLFGDGVAVLGLAKSWSKSLHAFLLTPLLSGSSGKDMHILLTVLWKSKLAPQSFNKFWRLMAWSLDALNRGVWPHEDMFGRQFAPGSVAHSKAGKPLAGHFRARVVAITGDLEFLHTGYGLQNSNSLFPCSKCQCNTTNIPWTDTLSAA